MMPQGMRLGRFSPARPRKGGLKMFSRGKSRIVGAVLLTMVLAMVQAAPAGAAGRSGWGEGRSGPTFCTGKSLRG